MPINCKNPRYRYTRNGKTRLAFCGNKVVESKPKKIILFENKYNKKIHVGPKKGYYYVFKGKKVYVK